MQYDHTINYFGSLDFRCGMAAPGRQGDDRPRDRNGRDRHPVND